MRSQQPEVRRRTRRHQKVAGAVAAVGVLLAGCGQDRADTVGSEHDPADEERVGQAGDVEAGAARDDLGADDPGTAGPGSEEGDEHAEPPEPSDGSSPGTGGQPADGADGADGAADLDRFDIEHHDLGEQFGDLNGVFVLHDVGSETLLVHGADAADEPFQPASTFKIANALIALETGVVTGVDEVRERDPALAPEAAWWPDAWLQPHSMETGFPMSTLWLFQALARDIGPDRMTRWLADLDYGNAEIGGGIDRFWIDGDLRISATQQVRFLRRLLADDLPASPGNQQQVRDLMQRDAGSGWTLYGKTGWTGHLDEYDGTGVGWFVGWVESQGTQWVFATRLEVTPGTDLAERERLTRDILAELGVLPSNGT